MITKHVLGRFLNCMRIYTYNVSAFCGREVSDWVSSNYTERQNIFLAAKSLRFLAEIYLSSFGEVLQYRMYIIDATFKGTVRQWPMRINAKALKEQ